MDERTKVEGFPDWEIRRAGREKNGLFYWHLFKREDPRPQAITKRRATQGDAQKFARKYIQEQARNALG